MLNDRPLNTVWSYLNLLRYVVLVNVKFTRTFILAHLNYNIRSMTWMNTKWIMFNRKYILFLLMNDIHASNVIRVNCTICQNKNKKSSIFTCQVIIWKICFLFVCFMVLNATFNNISVIYWRLVVLVEETGEPRENHRPVASHWQTLSHNVVHLLLVEIWTHNISGDRHWFHR